MPLELLLENQKVRAAFWQDLVLPLVVRKDANTSPHRSYYLPPSHIALVGIGFALLAPSKIFEVTHCFGNPRIKYV